jgi:hypothetical protein
MLSRMPAKGTAHKRESSAPGSDAKAVEGSRAISPKGVSTLEKNVDINKSPLFKKETA